LSPTVNTIVLIVFVFVIGLALMLGGMFFAIISPKGVHSRLNRYVRTGKDDNSNSLWKQGLDPEQRSHFRYQINNALAIFSSERLQLKISSTYWSITDTEFILIRFFSTIIGFGIGWLITSNALGGIGLATVIYLLPGFLLYNAIQVRQKLFQDQLLDTLILIKGAVQSGFSLLQSLEVVIKEMSAPSSEEFARVVREVQIGLSLSEALQNLSNRMESEDLKLVVTAIIINTQTGGNLTLMLNSVTNTIRDRIHLLGEVRALTTYGRSAAYMLTFLPFAAAVMIFLISPDYFKNVWVDRTTQYILVYAVISLLLGNIWLRRISNINV